jgi:hypothetical protein
MNVKKYYMLYPDQSGINGVPIYLNARLWENIKDRKNLMEPLSKYYGWDKYEYKEEKFPDKLYLIIQTSKISFDYYPYRSGIIVSHNFLSLLSKYTNNFSFVPLDVYSNKMKEISDKKYYFLKFQSYLVDGFDYKESKYTINQSDNGDVLMINNHPWIADVEKLRLNQNIINKEQVFCLHGWIFFNKPFISEKVLDNLLNEKLYGIKYVEFNKIIDFYNNRDYLKKTPLVIG